MGGVGVEIKIETMNKELSSWIMIITEWPRSVSCSRRYRSNCWIGLFQGDMKRSDEVESRSGFGFTELLVLPALDDPNDRSILLLQFRFESKVRNAGNITEVFFTQATLRLAPAYYSGEFRTFPTCLLKHCYLE